MAQCNHRNAASRPSIYQTVTDRIISSLKAGVIPLEKPWKTPRYAGGPFPRNFYAGKPYRGINVLLLWSSEYNSSFWPTFKQAQALKGTVRKGEHGTQIIFYKQLPEHAQPLPPPRVAVDYAVSDLLTLEPLLPVQRSFAILKRSYPSQVSGGRDQAPDAT